MAATEQFNVRVPPEIKEAFRARALREGLSQAELLAALLKQRGPLPVGPKASPPANEGNHRDGRPAGGEEPVHVHDRYDFATWLSGRTSTPRALCALAIRGGRVTVGGVPWTAETIDKPATELPIVYEGRPV